MSKAVHYLTTTSNGINKLNEWVGKIFRWLILPLTVLVTLEVILRYVFNRPTIWVWDVNIQLLGAMVVMGAGYVYLTDDGHIRIDAFTEKLSEGKRVILELLAFLFFVFLLSILLWKTSLSAGKSLAMMENYDSFWAPPIYILKTMIPIGCLLFLLQGISRFLRNIVYLITRKKAA